MALLNYLSFATLVFKQCLFLTLKVITLLCDLKQIKSYFSGFICVQREQDLILSFIFLDHSNIFFEITYFFPLTWENSVS